MRSTHCSCIRANRARRSHRSSAPRGSGSGRCARAGLSAAARRRSGARARTRTGSHAPDGADARGRAAAPRAARRQ